MAVTERDGGDVQVVEVPARRFAAVRRTAARSEIPLVLVGALDAVWPVLRSRGTRAGHNVALYRELGGNRVEMTCGVEVEPPFEDAGEVALHRTPSGAVAHLRHEGGHETLASTDGRASDWLRDHGLPAIAAYWEAYDDVDERGGLLGVDLFFLLPDGFTA